MRAGAVWSANPNESDAMTETITWHPVSEPPDSDITVLLFEPDADEPVFMGYHNGEAWCDAESFRAEPTHWADMPKGPTA
jgi:hypothetical protein